MRSGHSSHFIGKTYARDTARAILSWSFCCQTFDSGSTLAVLRGSSRARDGYHMLKGRLFCKRCGELLLLRTRACGSVRLCHQWVIDMTRLSHCIIRNDDLVSERITAWPRRTAFCMAGFASCGPTLVLGIAHFG